MAVIDMTNLHFMEVNGRNGTFPLVCVWCGVRALFSRGLAY